MPRAYRYILPGLVYHLTHRCHNRRFLLKFAKDRDTYRRMLRERLAGSEVHLLSYCITSNHVHQLVTLAGDAGPELLSRFMQQLEGDFAQHYNLRKGRHGGFWEDRFHATMVEGGLHLQNCLRYIDLNMVRAGMVEHPAQWRWTAYGELAGLRRRYRLLDIDRLMGLLGVSDERSFREHYVEEIEEALAKRRLQREAQWTEALAVGSEAYVRGVARRIPNRMQVSVDRSESGSWTVREQRPAYVPLSPSKCGSKVPI